MMMTPIPTYRAPETSTTTDEFQAQKKKMAHPKQLRHAHASKGWATHYQEIRVPYATQDIDRFLRISPEHLAALQLQAEAGQRAQAKQNDDDDNDKEPPKKYGLAALASNSPKESKLRTIGQYAMAATNAGIFAQNIGTFVRSAALDQVPQSFNLIGSVVNIGSCFVPAPLKMPMFVLGTSMFMGGTALARSHVNQSAVPDIALEKKTLKEVADARWNSNKHFPHPHYTRLDTKDGVKHLSFSHLAHPGYLAHLARKQYFDTLYPTFANLKHATDRLNENKHFNLNFLGEFKYAPASFAASTLAGTKQLYWMLKQMATEKGFSRDALKFVTRKDIIKGVEYTMPAAPEYALALGAAIPATLLFGASAVTGVRKVSQLLNKPKTEEEAQAREAKKQAAEDPFSRKPADVMKTVANVSSAFPQVANLMLLPLVAFEASGLPLHICPSGTKVQHAITPRLNASLIGAGSAASLVTAGLSTLSDVGVLPRYAGYLGDMMFMASSGLTGAGLMRTLFEQQFRITTLAHLYSTPDSQQHMHQLVMAYFRGWKPGFGQRMANLPQPKMMDAQLNAGKNTPKQTILV
jgi:hypothetical protein